ncbi:MAG: folate-binding protein [Beijerinckiaceae bacterium]|nr:folate-binding protein [Beijerinckiaceae bacterium]
MPGAQSEAKVALLGARAVLRISGADARTWLQGLVTNDVEHIAAGEARFAAFLTPQGKIIADFFIVPDGDGLLLDCAADAAAGLAKRLTMYKLRAQVAVSDVSGSLAVAAGWGGPGPLATQGRIFDDPRDARLGWRVIAPPSEIEKLGEPASESEWQAHRIACGTPEGGVDFVWGDTFPHEANMDRLNGIDFKKGCYVGQEVVSRVQHRGLARKRVSQVRITGAAPPPGTEVFAGDIAIGVMGSSAGGAGLALLRLDKAEDARAGGRALTAQDATLSVITPPVT